MSISISGNQRHGKVHRSVKDLCWQHPSAVESGAVPAEKTAPPSRRGAVQRRAAPPPHHGGEGAAGKHPAAGK